MKLTGWGRLVASQYTVNSAVRAIDYVSGIFSGSLPDDRSYRYAVEFILHNKMYRTRWFRSTRAAVNEWQSISDASKFMNADDLKTRFRIDILADDSLDEIWNCDADD